eukprot:Skav211357  [mRNA]  locus=scaffold677:233421:234537:- [translate_table: standard]
MAAGVGPLTPPVLQVDISEKALAMAKGFGADHCVDASKEHSSPGTMLGALSQLLVSKSSASDVQSDLGTAQADVCIEVIGSKATFEQAIVGGVGGG